MKLPLLSVLTLTAFASADSPAPLPPQTPWKLKDLERVPAVEWLDQTSPVHTLFYTAEPFKGKPSKVFAVYATPATIATGEKPKGPWPGVVLIHGGGGSAFPEWVTLWAKRGYAAIAMDLGGKRPDLAAAHDDKKRTLVEGGGPDQGHPSKFNTIATEDLSDDWPYHAVANAVLAHSLLRAQPGVDPGRTAVTGISWGGYTTCLVASVDSRFKAAVPVYGCGFLNDNSAWMKEFANLGPEKTKRWVEMYDPRSYLPSCRVPMFFVNGTNDFAYPLDSYMKSFDAVPGEKSIRIGVKMPHGHPQGWAPEEIGAFIDSKLTGGPKLPVLEKPTTKDTTATSAVKDAEVASAELVFTTAEGPINKLEWQTAPAAIQGGAVSAPMPADARIYYFTAKTTKGLMVSSPVVIRR